MCWLIGLIIGGGGAINSVIAGEGISGILTGDEFAL